MQIVYVSRPTGLWDPREVEVVSQMEVAGEEEVRETRWRTQFDDWELPEFLERVQPERVEYQHPRGERQ